MTSPVAPPRALLSIAVHLSVSGPEAAPDAAFCREALRPVLDALDSTGDCPASLSAIKASAAEWMRAEGWPARSLAASRLQFEVGRYYARAAADHVQSYIGGPSS